MATRFEKTVTATEFKAKCLDLMDQLAQRKLDRVVVTKRGRVVMEAVPPSDTSSSVSLPPIFGFMKDSTHIPDDFDWDAPTITEADIEAMVDSTLAQLRQP